MKFFGFLALALSAGFVACNDGSSDSATTNDTATTTTTVDNTTTTTATSMNNYTALADTFRVNSEAGNYLDPRTGKSMKIRVDTATGMRMNETDNQPVWRYVDKRDYKVYSGDDMNSMWDTVGTARMQNNKLEYMGENNSWTNYDKRWKSDDDTRMKTWKSRMTDTSTMSGTSGSKMMSDSAQ